MCVCHADCGLSLSWEPVENIVPCDSIKDRWTDSEKDAQPNLVSTTFKTQNQTRNNQPWLNLTNPRRDQQVCTTLCKHDSKCSCQPCALNKALSPFHASCDVYFTSPHLTTAQITKCFCSQLANSRHLYVSTCEATVKNWFRKCFPNTSQSLKHWKNRNWKPKLIGILSCHKKWDHEWGDSSSKVRDKKQRRILTNCRLSDQELAGDKRKGVGNQ